MLSEPVGGESAAENVSTGESQQQSKEQSFDYDDILNHIGQMGKFQMRTFILLCLPALFPGIVVWSYTFTGAIPDYRCLVPGCENKSGTSYETNWLNNTMAPIPSNGKSCSRYDHNWTSTSECVEGAKIDPEKLVACTEFVFDTSQFETTIVSDFNLACDDEGKQTLANTIYMASNLVGAVTLGSIADVIGRKKSFTIVATLLAVSFTATTFSPDFVTFTVLRFISGVADVGFFLITFVWGVEAVGDKYRITCGFIYQLAFSLGSAILGVVAYYIRRWRTLQLIISAPIFIFVSYYWVVPESIRWLIVKKKYTEARKIIAEAAEMNGVLVPAHLLVPTQDNVEIGKTSDHETADRSSTAGVETAKKAGNFLDVFRSAALCKRIVIMMFAWIASVMGYYGISLSAANLAGDFYLNYEMQMLVEIPSYIFGIFAMDKFGRRFTLSGGLIASGIFCLITGLVPEDPPELRMSFSVIGKFFISCVYATVYSYTAELFSTSVRTSSVGLCSTSGRIGGILSPLVALLGKTDPAVPFVVFAGVNVIIGLLTILLPETLGVPLPATMEDAIELEKYTIRFCRRRSSNQNTRQVLEDQEQRDS